MNFSPIYLIRLLYIKSNLIVDHHFWQAVHLERHLEFLRMILGGFGQGKHRDSVRSPVSSCSSFVLARIRIQHSSTSHHVRDHVKIPAEIGVAEIRENRTIAVYLLDEARKSLLGNSHQETFAQILATLRVVQGEVDLRVLADRVAEISHAEVEMMGQDFLVLLPPKGPPS